MSSAETPISRPRVVPRQQAVAKDSVRVGAPGCGSSRIEVHTAPDGRVLAIDITCSCGEQHRVLCQYAEENV